MKFTIIRDVLLKPLQQVTTLLSHRPLQPILNNLHLKIDQEYLLLTGSDLEVEMVGRVTLETCTPSKAITVPARKLLDICRGLPEGARIDATLTSQNHLQLCSGRSRFLLSTLPADNFPHFDTGQTEVELALPQTTLKRLIDATQFSMAHQDVRYHLNGMLFETEGKRLRSVATDGHRLAHCTVPTEQPVAPHAVIIPRKGILELGRLLDNSTTPLQLQIGHHYLQANMPHLRFTTKLLEGRFPDYRLVLPQQTDNLLETDRQTLRQALIRAAILSHEKCRGVHLQLSPGLLKVVAKNPAQEEAEEQLDVSYQGKPLEISFNVNYLLDILNVLKGDQVCLHFTDAYSATLIKESHIQEAIYVVMPLRL